jgi:DNA-binding transcriptional regulator LsrR (DeoR family)
MAQERDRIRLLVEVSRLYYDQQRSQQEIAEQLDVSRATVSRLLTQARTDGLVQITIRNPFAEEEALEERLVGAFGLQAAAVCRTVGEAEVSRLEHLAVLGGETVAQALAPGAVIGVMASRTLGAVIHRLAPQAVPEATVVPLIGGWSADGCDWHANANARTLAEKLCCGYLQCHAPAFVASAATRDALLEERVIARVLQAARTCTVALLGVGQLDAEASIVRSGSFTVADVATATAWGALAQIGTVFLDPRGWPVPTPFDSRGVGVTAQELRRVPTVIAVAAGRAKVAPLRAVLAGGWIHRLVTDVETARGVLEGREQPAVPSGLEHGPPEIGAGAHHAALRLEEAERAYQAKDG